MSVADHFRVFSREIKRFAEVWAVKTTVRDAAPRPAPTGALWQAEARGPDWTTRTTFEILAWDDLAAADMARSPRSHLKGQARTVVDMITSGTLVRYFRASRRYGLFFLFTYVLLATLWLVAAALGIATGLALAAPLGLFAATAAGLAVTALAGMGLMRWPGRRWHLKQSLDLAEFSVDFAYGRHPEVDERVHAFARRIVAVGAEARANGGLDEIIVAGHSLGAMHMICALAQASALDPQFGHDVPVRLLTLGSTTAKFALHPAGERLRAAARAVAQNPVIGWLEIQSRDDMVSFYKVNPVTLGPAEIVDRKLKRGDYAARPLVRHAAIRDMITPETYRRFRFDVMRLHCQCFLAGDKRAHHDFYAYVCGPMPFDALAADTGGLLSYVDEQGRLKPRAGTPTPSLGVAGPSNP